jgi:hypothetical protein
MKRALQVSVLVVWVAVSAFTFLTLTSQPATAVIPCPPADGPITNIFCGGVGNLPCPGNLECVDDPRDDCCPPFNGADCGGVCAPKKK